MGVLVKVKYSALPNVKEFSLENCEISHFVRCEMKFAHIRVSEYFTFAKQIFHSVAISLDRRANFVEIYPDINFSEIFGVAECEIISLRKL